MEWLDGHPEVAARDAETSCVWSFITDQPLHRSLPPRPDAALQRVELSEGVFPWISCPELDE